MCQDIDTGKDFLKRPPAAQKIKSGIDTLFCEIERHLHSKEHNAGRQQREHEEIFASYLSEISLIPRLHE